MHGYYITSLFADDLTFTTGVGKKIKSQIATLNRKGLNTKLLNIFFQKNVIQRLQSKFSYNYYDPYLPDDFFDSDFYYIRKFRLSFSFIGLLKKIKKRSPGKIVIEIPTYPYDFEVRRNIVSFLNLLFDKLLRNKLKKYVDRIVSYSSDNMIFGVPVISIQNGIDCSETPLCSIDGHGKIINMVAVAKFSKWHGYDRLIKGLYLYYQENNIVDVIVYFIGNGDELDNLVEMTRQFKLSDHIYFTGFLSGKKLDDICDIADLGVCSLGDHRRNLSVTSELKSREYLARGIPMVSSSKIDIIPDGFPYCLYVSEDDTPIDIKKILEFYTELYSRHTRAEIIAKTRQFAEKYCDMSAVMTPVINYISENTEKLMDTKNHTDNYL
jgi:glycosyltransferase involved in cell wall biosynthesis